MLTHAGSGHPGGSLSVIDLLVTIVFGRLRHDPRRPDWSERDRIVLSKGHAVPALYTVMARAGYFPESQLVALRKLGSPLQGHPDRVALPGIEAATGSLGQGLSISLGMALGLKLAKSPARVYCILGDGEIQEGQVWEAAMAGPKLGQPDHALDNLTVIVDYNRIQLDDFVARILDLEPLVAKWQAFGWPVLEIDGHDVGQIGKALDQAEATRGTPVLIVAHTVKGVAGNLGITEVQSVAQKLEKALRDGEGTVSTVLVEFASAIGTQVQAIEKALRDSSAASTSRPTPPTAGVAAPSARQGRSARAAPAWPARGASWRLRLWKP